LLSNSEYIVKVDVNKIFHLPSKVKYFRFKLNTFKQVLFVNQGVFSPIDSTLKVQKYQGSIVFNDFIEFDYVNELFKAEQNGKRLPISFNPGKSKDTFSFIIDNVIRKNTNDTLTLSWDGKPIGIDLYGSKKVIIPSLNQFKVNNIELKADSILRLKISFSDPLRANQNFDSLVMIKGASVSAINCNNKYLTVDFNDLLVQKIHLSISKDLVNIIGTHLIEELSQIVALEKDEPALRISDSTFIISEFSDNFHWEFEALKLKFVNVQIYKIFANNVLQFLQTNDFQGIDQIERVGSIVYQNTITLSEQLQYDPDKWTKYQININDFEPEEGCVYCVLVNFKSHQTVLPCMHTVETTKNTWAGFLDDYYSNKGDSVNNPCSDQFYGFRRGIHYNLYYTKLGILTKQIGNDSLYVWVTDINNAQSSKNVSIQILNYQQQLIANGISDNDGMVRFKLDELPSFIIARQGNNTTYLKLNKVSGQINNDNEKVYFIKKRKYWSPGDTLNFGFIHNATIKPMANSLLTLNIFSPDKKKIHTKLKPVDNKNQYLFNYFIPKGSEIGEYTAEIIINGLTFEESFEILPRVTDKIKINCQLSNESNSDYEYELSVENAKVFAGKLNYNVEVNSEYESVSLKTYEKFHFGNSNNKKRTEKFSGVLDEFGKRVLKLKKGSNNSELKVNHTFYIRIINENVGFNESLKSYSNLIKKPIIGINLNYAGQKKNLFYCDSTLVFNFLLLDKNYNKIEKKTNAQVKLYKKGNDNKFNFLSSEPIQFKYGRCNWSTLFNFPNKGKYKLEIRTNNGNAVAYRIFDIEWPEKYSSKNINSSLLGNYFNIGNDTIFISDSLNVEIKSEESGSVLLTAENQNGINYHKRFIVNKGVNVFRIPVNNEFYPLTELYTCLFRPNKTAIFSKKTLHIKRKTEGLNPIIYGLNEVEAENTITVTVKEKNNYPLNYIMTVSPANEIDNNSNLVDFYSNSNYSFKNVTADVYGNFMFSNNRANSSEIKTTQERLIEKNPFSPFNFQRGPFYIAAGESKIHKITMPQYIGDVNISIIASSIDYKNIKEVVHRVSVNKSIMILTSAPDNISPNEEFYLPINVFSSRKEKREAIIELKNNFELNVLDELEKKVWVNYLQTDTTNFKLKSKRRTGLGGINIFAIDSNLTESRSLKIPIKSNTFIDNRWVEKELDSEEKWQTRFTPIGIKGTNHTAVEFSENSNIHLSQLILKLLNNSHPDIEHLISSAFPLMFIDELTNINEGLSLLLKEKIQKVLNKLIYYQLPSGGFSYWLNNEQEQNWCSSYAGYFMIEAQKKGFDINQAVYNKWLRYQRRKCLTWNFIGGNSDLEQAFGLFTLALANKPDVNSMQKLKNKKLSDVAALQLSMAFNLIEESKIAKQIISEVRKDYIYLNDHTFGNPLRNNAIKLESYRYLNNKLVADSIKSELEKLIVDANYQSLQGISFSIIALAKYYKNDIKKLDKKIIYTVNRGKQKHHRSLKPYGIVQIPIEFTLTKTIDITNNTKNKINVSIDYSGKPDKTSATINNKFIQGTLIFKNSLGHVVNKGKVNANSQLNAEVSIVPLKSNLNTNYMVLVFPIANCFDFLSFTDSKNEHIHFIHQTKNKVFYYFTLPDEGIQINIPLSTKHKGYFRQPPVQVYSLYNPMVKAVLTGEDFSVW